MVKINYLECNKLGCNEIATPGWYLMYKDSPKTPSLGNFNGVRWIVILDKDGMVCTIPDPHNWVVECVVDLEIKLKRGKCLSGCS